MPIKHTAVCATFKCQNKHRNGISNFVIVCKKILVKFPEEFQKNSKGICNSSRILIIILGADDFGMWPNWKKNLVKF